MNLRNPGMLYATRLVRAGHVLEATRAIQTMLRGRTPEEFDAPADLQNEPIEGAFRVVDAPITARRQRGFVSRSYSSSSGAREYKVYVPAAHGGEPLPVIVMLHGCKQDPDDFAAGTKMNALAEQHGFIVAYPKQSTRANGSACWNWFESEHQDREHGEPSLIAGITRKIVEEFGADASRVYVAGLSAGGAMAAVMAATHPDVYAAVGIHSGLPYGSALDVPSAFAAMRGAGGQTRPRKGGKSGSYRVPVIVFHGDRDSTVHPQNADLLIAAAAAADASVDSANAGAKLERVVERGRAAGRSYTRVIQRDAGGTSWLEQWTVHGAAHAWSGGSTEGSFSDSEGPDASSEMVRFFLQHARESAATRHSPE